MLKDNNSLVAVSHKPRFIELAKASMRRRLGKEYVFPAGEDDIVWIIPDIDELGSIEGSYAHYIKRIKVPILKYELGTFQIGPEEGITTVSEGLCDELLKLRVYAKALPIEMIVRA